MAQPEDFIYLLLDDSKCLVDFLEHFENVSYLSLLSLTSNGKNYLNHIFILAFRQMVYIIIKYIY